MDKLLLISRPIEDELQDYKKMFEATLAHEDEYLGKILDYIRHRTGKMMRPMLVLLIAKALGRIGEATLRSAVSLELLHTASLVHDDVVDESKKRRGRPSVNASYGNKLAVLTGDYMLSKSLHEACIIGDIRIVELIARLGGQLSEGEVKQLNNIQAAQLSEATYFDIIRHKTAALFVACAKLGAISVGATQEQIEKAALLGEILGTCFQIKDDIFDYYDEKEVGKPTGNDMAEGKITLPAIYAINHSQDPKWIQVAQSIKSGTADKAAIQSLIEYTKSNGGIDYAEQWMEKLKAEALTIIEEIQQPDIQTALTLYLRYTIEREK